MNQEGNTEAALLALRAEGERNPGKAVEQRVLARLESSLLGAPSVGPERHSTGVKATSLFARPLVLWGAFALGGASSAVAYAVLRREPAPRLVFIERAPVLPEATVEALLPSLPPTAVTSEPTRPTEPARVHRSRPVAPVAEPVNPSPELPLAPAPTPATLAEEQKLLDGARAALGSGNFAQALSLTEAHRARYAKTQLGEEREAIAIKALAGAQRGAEAEERLTAFALEFPRSPLLPSLRRALAPKP